MGIPTQPRRKQKNALEVKNVEEELFAASVENSVIKALGMRIDCKLEDLHIYVNGRDISKSVVLEEIRITKEPKGE